MICHPQLSCGLCPACRIGDDMRCSRGLDFTGLNRAGGFAELLKTTDRGVLRVPTFNLVLPEISVVGNAVGTHDDLRELVGLAATGAVSVLTRTYPLDAFADAVADLEQGRMHGRGVLVP